MALRVLAEKVGLPGYADMPASLEQLSKRERATFCNEYWQKEQQRVSLDALTPLLYRSCGTSQRGALLPWLGRGQGKLPDKEGPQTYRHHLSQAHLLAVFC